MGFKSLQETVDTTSLSGKLVFHIFGTLAEFERNLIRERTRARLAVARARGNDAATAYGFMYSALANVVMPVDLPAPEEDRKLTKDFVAALTDPSETYGGSATYFQTSSDLTNKHCCFKSLIAPSDIFFDFNRYNFAEGQPVRVIKRMDE